MRARLAIQSSEIKVQIREISLGDKALEFLETSPKGTVPVVVTQNNVIEESFDIMRWALDQSDPEGWLNMPDAGYDWISRNDGPFKTALDHTKYSVRYPSLDIYLERERATEFIHDLDTQLANSAWMFGNNCSLADISILPFVRQFSNINNGWFASQGWQNVDRWLNIFVTSNRFNSIMTKYDNWAPDDPILLFPNKPN